jgi:hypothetical protein
MYSRAPKGLSDLAYNSYPSGLFADVPAIELTAMPHQAEPNNLPTTDTPPSSKVPY